MTDLLPRGGQYPRWLASWLLAYTSYSRRYCAGLTPDLLSSLPDLWSGLGCLKMGLSYPGQGSLSRPKFDQLEGDKIVEH